MNTVLVTGGLGYIGSYFTLKLLLSGYRVVIADNCSNTQHDKVIGGLDKAAAFEKNSCTILNVDCTKYYELDVVFNKYDIDTVIHLAGFKSVYESYKNKTKYLFNNTKCTENVLNCMRKYNVEDLMFSSSCTIYGDGVRGQKFNENDAYDPKSPYATSKALCEQMILNDDHVSAIIFRYFNPIGYHPCGHLYEYPSPKSTHNNLFYEITQVLLGNKKKLTIYGDCFETSDGTAERNYLDIDDLWKAHEIAFLMFAEHGEHEIYNLGNVSYTVQQVIDEFYHQGMYFQYDIKSAPKGAFSCTDASISKATSDLGWYPMWSLRDTIFNLINVMGVQSGRSIGNID